MIHSTEDFYNKVASEIKGIYFANENHGYSQNKSYHDANYTIELFSNGCLDYRKFIGRLARHCNDSTLKIHAIVEKYIVSFGEYTYKPKKSSS